MHFCTFTFCRTIRVCLFYGDIVRKLPFAIQAAVTCCSVVRCEYSLIAHILQRLLLFSMSVRLASTGSQIRSRCAACINASVTRSSLLLYQSLLVQLSHSLSLSILLHSHSSAVTITSPFLHFGTQCQNETQCCSMRLCSSLNSFFNSQLCASLRLRNDTQCIQHILCLHIVSVQRARQIVLLSQHSSASTR